MMRLKGDQQLRTVRTESQESEEGHTNQSLHQAVLWSTVKKAGKHLGEEQHCLDIHEQRSRTECPL